MFQSKDMFIVVPYILVEYLGAKHYLLEQLILPVQWGTLHSM